MNWKRILASAVALVLLPQVLAWLQGVLLGFTWEAFAPTLDDAVVLARPWRRILIVLLALLVYVLCLRRVAGRVAEHAVALFVTASVLLIVIEAAVTANLAESINIRYVGTHALIAVVALVATLAWRRFARPAPGHAKMH